MMKKIIIILGFMMIGILSFGQSWVPTNYNVKFNGQTWFTKTTLFSDMTRFTDTTAWGSNLTDSIYVYSNGGNLTVDKYDGAGTLGTIVGNGGWNLTSYSNILSGIIQHSDFGMTSSGFDCQYVKNHAALEYRAYRFQQDYNGFLFSTSTKLTSSDLIRADSSGLAFTTNALLNNKLTVTDSAIFNGKVISNSNLYVAGNGQVDGGFQHDSVVNVVNYGALGDGVVVNDAAFNLAAIAVPYNGTIYIPSGIFNKTDTWRVHNKGNVKIICDGTILNNLSSADTLISILGNKSVKIEGLNIDMNNKASQADKGIVIKNITNKVDVSECDIYNFGTWNAYGMILENVGNQTEIQGYNDGAAFSITKCSFRNINTSTEASYSYASNNTKGIGLCLKDSAEYGRVSDCDFYNISTGIESDGGANNSITNCNIEGTNSYQGGTLQLGGGIYLKDSNGNGGKYTIEGNHINHNWTSCITIKYDNAAARPTSIIGNQFIANSYDVLDIGNSSSTTRYIISNNYFDRCYNYTPIGTYPFTGNRCFLKMLNVGYAIISNNHFYGSDAYGIKQLGTTNANTIVNNMYGTITTAFDSVNVVNTNVNFNNNDYATINKSIGDTLYCGKAIRIGATDNTLSQALVVKGAGAAQSSIQLYSTGASGATVGPYIIARNDDGAVQASGDKLLTIEADGRKTSGNVSTALIECFAGAAWATNFNSYWAFSTTNTTARSEKFRIAGDGTITQTYKLGISDSLTTQKESSVVLDDGTITIAASQHGTIYVYSYNAGTCDGVAAARFNTDASVTQIQAADVLDAAFTDSDTFTCIYDGGTSVIVKNRQGGTRTLQVIVYYSNN